MIIRWMLTGLLLSSSPLAGWAQGWSPQRNLEIVVSSVPGGSNDKTARTVEAIVTANKLINVSITVVNKPGGGGNIALTYLTQRPADGHTVMIATPGLLTAHITGSRAMMPRSLSGKPRCEKQPSIPSGKRTSRRISGPTTSRPARSSEGISTTTMPA